MKLEFDPRFVDETNVFKYVRDDNYYDSGMDTMVFVWKPWVLKRVTNNRLTFRQLQNYKAATDLIAEKYDGYELDIGLWGVAIMSFEPIIKIISSSGSQILFEVCRFAEGTKVNKGDYSLFDDRLKEFSLQISRETGIEGIDIWAPNTLINKISGRGIWKKNSCRVTDICTHIERLVLP